MSATCFDVVPKCNLHVGSKSESEIRNFTCINRRARCLIWTHSLNQFHAYLRKAKGKKEEKKEEEETHFAVFGLLVFFPRACYLSLEILYSLEHCLVIYLEEVFFSDFSTP